MRIWLHILLTLTLTVASTVAAVFLALVVGFSFDEFLRMREWPRFLCCAVWLLPFIGLQLGGLLMSLIPCVCPSCGGKARLAAADGIKLASLRGLGSGWTWCCHDCHWSTGHWSSFYRRHMHS